jgi:hypothetical protein
MEFPSLNKALEESLWDSCIAQIAKDAPLALTILKDRVKPFYLSQRSSEKLLLKLNVGSSS